MNLPIMRFLPGSVAFACALATLTGACSHLMAQPARQPRPPQAGTQGPVQQASNPGTRPQQGAQGKQTAQVPSGQAIVRPTFDEPETESTPELDQLLNEWEERSSQIKILYGTHTRTQYNTVFQTEKVAAGRFFLQTPDKGRIDLVGVKPTSDKSARIGKNGQPFRVESDHAEKWVCTGLEILIVSDDEKTYEVVPLPDDLKGTNIIHGPLPFLFGMKAADAKRRFQITLQGNNDKQAMLIVIPRMESDRHNYSKAYVMLDKKTYLPSAVKLFDPSGGLETVYKFESVKANDPNYGSILPKIFGGEKDPFKLNLKSYTPVVRAPEETMSKASGRPSNAPTTPAAPKPNRPMPK